MPRVIGIDPGTVSIDLCGLDNGRLFLDRSWPTAEALADPAPFVAELEAAGPPDLVVGPSGYGVPITRVQDITEEALRLAFLAAPRAPRRGSAGVRGPAGGRRGRAGRGGAVRSRGRGRARGRRRGGGVVLAQCRRCLPRAGWNRGGRALGARWPQCLVQLRLGRFV